MLLKASIRQSFRAPVRLIASFVVMALVCAFLVVGINLRQTARNNLLLLNEEFDVVAIPTFKGSVDRKGQLTENVTGTDYLDYRETYARNFDLSLLKNATGVKDVLVHKQLGVFLDSRVELYPGKAQTRNTNDIFIFTYDGKEPMTFARAKTQDAHITVEWSARGYHQLSEWREGTAIYNKVDTNMIQNRWPSVIESLGLDSMWPETEEGKKTGEFILQPGQRYIASGKWHFVSYKDRDGKYIPGREDLHWVEIQIDDGHSKQELRYEGNAFIAEQYCGFYQETYPCIMPYTEDFWETDAGVYYRDAIEICQVNKSTLTAVSTEDVSMYLPFYNGGVYISDGRNFSEEEYEEGRKVCLVSKYLADMNGWELGTKLDLTFFEAMYGHSPISTHVTTYYEPLVQQYDPETSRYRIEKTDLFFDAGEYEIVGFYSGNVTKSHFNEDIQYTKNEGIDRRVIIVPQKSVSNEPDVPLSNYNTTLLLDDEMTMLFMSDMEASGLTEPQTGQYEVDFTIYDQGLGQIKQSLRQLDIISKLTLLLACAAAIVVIILLAVLTVLQNRRQIATLRSLGVRKRQIPAAVLSGMLLACLLGAMVGGVLGHALSDSVAEYILDTAQIDMADTSFSAILAKEDMEEEAQYVIAIQSQPKIAAFVSAAVWCVLSALCCVLILPESDKSPMLRLGAKE